MGRLSPAKHGRATALIALFAFALPIPAQAAGETLITQAKANAGNVTPGDTPGFPVTPYPAWQLSTRRQSDRARRQKWCYDRRATT